MDKLVSIIIPVYNVANYLVECLESVVQQTYHNWACILVDDGSTDNSGKICDEYADNDNRFVVIRKENGGPSSSRNAALKVIGGGYVCFLDSDDCIDKDFLERAVSLIEENDVDIVQFKSTRQIERLGENSNSVAEKRTRLEVYDDILKFRVIDPLVWGKLYRSSVIKDIRFNEECHVLEDVEFLTKIMRNCTCVCSEYLAYYYRITPGSLITQGLNERKLLGSIACQNSCIQMLQGTDLESRSYWFKYNSMFNWLIRTANQNNWSELYKIIRDQILRDIKQIVQCPEINVKTKAILIACAISPSIAHVLCQSKNRN